SWGRAVLPPGRDARGLRWVSARADDSPERPSAIECGALSGLRQCCGPGSRHHGCSNKRSFWSLLGPGEKDVVDKVTRVQGGAHLAHRLKCSYLSVADTVRFERVGATMCVLNSL